ncbi:M23 family metallopeptidase [Streptomyces sp. NPDC050504]|uniref:M23 family metallopeptidase n=1 Tax=Streptomyces sp. NPDC050504 TaxID=3365618 RepID=UPI0037A74F4E
MDEFIVGPPDTRMGRRAVLGAAAGLLVGTALPETAAAAQDDDCAATGHDPRFEADLARADVEVPDAPALPQERYGPPGKFARPLRRRYRVTTRYGVPGDWLAGRHTGIDLAVPHGTPVHAVGAGVVVLARRSGDYGNAVTVRMRDGRYAIYAHLSRISVRKGGSVRAGARLGHSGSTGRSTGPHLHLEIRARRPYGSDIDPVAYLARHGVRLR